jgi:hypothetical protein
MITWSHDPLLRSGLAILRSRDQFIKIKMAITALQFEARLCNEHKCAEWKSVDRARLPLHHCFDHSTYPVMGNDPRVVECMITSRGLHNLAYFTANNLPLSLGLTQGIVFNQLPRLHLTVCFFFPVVCTM